MDKEVIVSYWRFQIQLVKIYPRVGFTLGGGGTVLTKITYPFAFVEKLPVLVITDKAERLNFDADSFFLRTSLW